MGHMKKKVVRLTESFKEIKEANRLLPTSISKVISEREPTKRWEIKSSYGDSGLIYRDDHSAAYVASRMPSVFAACFRVLTEVFIPHFLLSSFFPFDSPPHPLTPRLFPPSALLGS